MNTLDEQDCCLACKEWEHFADLLEELMEKELAEYENAGAMARGLAAPDSDTTTEIDG